MILFILNGLKSRINFAILFICIASGMQAQHESPELKQGFINARDELAGMLNGKAAPDIERAVFITENPFNGNAMSYDMFQNEISFHLAGIKAIAKGILFSNIINPKANALVNADSAQKNIRNVVNNYAIFKYMTDTTFFLDDSVLYYTPPFGYASVDPFATRDWQSSQVRSLLQDDKHAGNCNALVLLFKIFSERLNSGAVICTAPNHIFIRHADENGIFYNVEIASRSFPGTGSIETITHTTDEAARSGIAMRELSIKQTVALQLVNLAKAYEHTFNSRTDEFVLSCANLCLQHDPMNLNAMLLKAECYGARITQQNKSVNQLQNDADFIAYQKQISQLYQAGYREMPADMRNKIIAATMRDSNYAAVSKDQTYTPFPGKKNYGRAFSFSNGAFEEVAVHKNKEQYFNTVYDTRLRKITNFIEMTPTYNSYTIDLVVFALSVDPLDSKYPHLNPYAFVANNPIIFIDPDGADIVDPSGKKVTITYNKDGSLGFSENATEDIKRVAKALNLTTTGRSQLKKVDQSDIKVKIKISTETKVTESTKDGATSKTFKMGDTKQGNDDRKDHYGKYVKDGKYGIKEATITIYEGTVKEAIENKNNIHSGLTAEQAIGAAAAHEIVHATDKDEIDKDLKSETESGKPRTKKETEAKPRAIEKKVISESKNGN